LVDLCNNLVLCAYYSFFLYVTPTSFGPKQYGVCFFTFQVVEDFCDWRTCNMEAVKSFNDEVMLLFRPLVLRKLDFIKLHFAAWIQL